MAEQYLPVPVGAARQIARLYVKDIVVIVALDREFDRTNVTTFGTTPEDKLRAAAMGADLGRAAGIPDDESMRAHEDFRRDLTAATWAAERDDLIGALKLAAEGLGLHGADEDCTAEIERIHAATMEAVVKFTKGGPR